MLCYEVVAAPYSSACDLWSTGACAHILICGEPPFECAAARAERAPAPSPTSAARRGATRPRGLEG
jgi:hypothetical protein